MPAAVRSRRSIWLVIAGVMTLALVVAVLARRAAVATAARTALRSAGAENVQLSVSAATPWRAQIDDLGFELNQNRIAARRVVVEREHWWQPRLSALRVEGAEVQWDAAQPRRGGEKAALPTDVPLDQVSIDGAVRVSFGEGDDETFEVKFDAKRRDATEWDAKIETRAPGAHGRSEVAINLHGPVVTWHDHRTEVDLARLDVWARRMGLILDAEPKLSGTLVVTGSGAYADGEWSNRGRVEWLDGTADAQPARAVVEIEQSPGEVRARVAESEFALAPWVPLLRRHEFLPANLSDVGGRLGFVGEVHYRDGVMGGAGDFRWRDGSVALAAPAITATGIAADIRFDDLGALHSQAGTVTIQAIATDALSVGNADVEIAFRGMDEWVVSRVALEALGGRLQAEPFTYWPAKQEFEATLLVDGIAIEQVLALTKDVPATAVGRVDGRVPVRWVDGNFYFGTGWLELTRGTTAELELHAQGLLTGGAPATDVRGEVMQKIETGLLRLVVSQLRLDLRPPQGPSDRTAVVRLVGRPKSGDLKTSVNLDVNVNGPVEQLLNLGMDSRLRFGGSR